MRRILIVAGTLLMGYALAGALLDAQLAKVGVVIFLAAVLVLHDGVFLPLVLGAGALVRNTTLRIAGLITLPVLVVGVPLALGFGRAADNPSALPLAYGRNLIVILASIWIVALGVTAIRKRSERRRGTPVRPERR